jgi:hypothetical protein
MVIVFGLQGCAFAVRARGTGNAADGRAAVQGERVALEVQHDRIIQLEMKAAHSIWLRELRHINVSQEA